MHLRTSAPSADNTLISLGFISGKNHPQIHSDGNQIKRTASENCAICDNTLISLGFISGQKPSADTLRWTQIKHA